jgi:hypothetical protein
LIDAGGVEMKRPIVIAKIVVLLLPLIGATGCGISVERLMATHEAVLRPTVQQEIWSTAEANVATAVPATLTAVAATQEVILISYHGRFVTASGGGAGWLLRQESHLTDCGWFTLHFLENGKVTLKTCHDQFVTAPASGTTRADWQLFQQPELTDCARFVLHERSDGVALETCAHRYVTAGDGGWEGDLAWSLVAETDEILAWELFTVLRR